MSRWVIFSEITSLCFSRVKHLHGLTASLSILIMVLMGLWHGFTWLYFLYGLYHGIMIAIENIFKLTTVNKKKVSKAYFYFRCFGDANAGYVLRYYLQFELRYRASNLQRLASFHWMIVV